MTQLALQLSMFRHHRGRSNAASNYLVDTERRLFAINRRFRKQFKEVIHKQVNVAVVAKQLTDKYDFILNVATHKIFVVVSGSFNF